MRNKLTIIISVMLMVSMLTACDNKPSDTEESSHRVLSYTDSEESPVLVTSSLPASFDSSSSEESSVDTSHKTESDTSKAESKASESLLTSSKTESRIVSSITSSTVETYTIYYNEVEQGDESRADSSEASSSERETTSEISSEIVSDTDSDTDKSSSSPSSEPVSHGSYTEDDIAFYYNGSIIHLGDDAQSVLSILGEPVTSDSSDYNYSDFWVSLTDGESEDEQKVSEIQIFGSGIETEKGVRVGMKLDEVLDIYGESSSVVNGEYRYYYKNKYMYIYLQNDIVLDIGYRIDGEVETPEG